MGRSELSDKELLELALKEPSVNEVQEFIQIFNIKATETEWANGPAIYWKFRNWCEDNEIQGRSRVLFHKEFRNHFRNKTLNDGDTGYAVEKKQFELTQEEYFKMRKSYRDEKKQKAKKRCKVPRIKPEL